MENPSSKTEFYSFWEDGLAGCLPVRRCLSPLGDKASSETLTKIEALGLSEAFPK